MAKDFKGALKNYQEQPKEVVVEEVKPSLNEVNLSNDINIEVLIESLVNDNSKTGSYTLLASNELYNFLRALSTVKRTTLKKLFTEALIDSIKSSSKEDIIKALEYKKNYLD